MNPQDFFRYTRSGFAQIASTNGLEVIQTASVRGTVDFAVDFYSKLVTLTLFAVSYVVPRLFKKYGLSFRFLQRVFAVYPQLLYLFSRRIDVSDNLYALGFVMVDRKHGEN